MTARTVLSTPVALRAVLSYLTKALAQEHQQIKSSIMVVNMAPVGQQGMYIQQPQPVAYNQPIAYNQIAYSPQAAYPQPQYYAPQQAYDPRGGYKEY